VESTWFGRSVIRSRRKLAYGDAQAVLDAADEQASAGGTGAAAAASVAAPLLQQPTGRAQDDVDAAVAANVLQMWGIAKQVRERRYASGALSLQTVKLGFVMNGDGDPIGAAPYKTNTANWSVPQRLVQESPCLLSLPLCLSVRFTLFSPLPRGSFRPTHCLRLTLSTAFMIRV
jgi:exoribonuclease R